MTRLFQRVGGRRRPDHDRELQKVTPKIPWENDVLNNGFSNKECRLFLPRPEQEKNTTTEYVRCFCGEVLCRHEDFNKPDCNYEEVINEIVHEEVREIFAKDKWNQRAPQITRNYRNLWQNPFRTSPTNACGKVHFSSIGDAKPAKFMRISDEDSVDHVWDFMKTTWRTMSPKPDLVVSIVGGAKNFRLEGLCRDKIQNGLLKIAETTQPMFITSGFNVGVMKAVGQIMKEGQSYSIRDRKAIHNIRCLGIAPWGFVRSRQTLEKRSFDVKYGMSKWYRGDYQPIPLNPYHTHFVLVDNGFRNRFTECGNIAKYRAKLEKRINKESPVVLVVVEGGSGVLSDICHSLAEDIPVIICNGTGRAADVMAYAVSRSDEKGELSPAYREKVKKWLDKLFGGSWTDTEVREENVDDLTERLCQCLKRKDRITVFDIRENQGLDFYVLSALFTGTRDDANREKNLALAISLNRPDLAELDLFGENDDWPLPTLYKNLQSCIVRDLDGFVRLIIQQEVFDMKKFLTKGRLRHIYEASIEANRNSLFSRLVSWKTPYTRTRVPFRLTKVGRVIEGLLDRCDKTVYGSDNDQEEELNDPYLELFIWAVLNERKILASLFWEYVDAPIATALLGSWLYYKMSEKLGSGDQEWSDNLLEGKRKMEELAVQTLSELQSRYPKQAMHCVEEDSPLWGTLTTFQIAAAADAKKFLSSATCQQSLRSEWMGDVRMQLWKVLVFLPLAIFLPCFIGVWGRFKKPTKYKDWKTKTAEFFCSPRVKFMNYLITYIIFLVMFTYLILFRVREEGCVLEYICALWTLAILMDEFHRLICVPALSKRSLCKMWRGALYMIYLISVVVVLIGVGIHYFTGSAKYVRTIYAVNCVFFYLRLLRFYTASEHLGPKLHIIKSTLRQLFFFSLITLVFLLAYGVPSQALMYEKREPYWGVLYDIVYVPYWQIYGELQLENIEDDESCSSNLADMNITDVSSCRQHSRMIPLMLAVYLFFANVLLLNLIIAIFTKIFEKVQSNSIEIWKYQMYFFIKEYKAKSVLPTPFSILEDTYRILRHVTHLCCDACDRKKKGLSYDDERHLRWVERQVTDRLLRRMKETEALSSNKHLYAIQKSISNLHSTLIGDLEVLRKMSGGAVRNAMGSPQASNPVTPRITRRGDRWGTLLHNHVSLTRAKQLVNTEYEPMLNRKAESDSDADGMDTVDGCFFDSDASGFGSESS